MIRRIGISFGNAGCSVLKCFSLKQLNLFFATICLLIAPWVAMANPDLTLTGTLAPSPVSVGELLTCQLTVTNGGNASATGVTLVDTLSSNAAFFSAAVSQGSYTQANGTVTCALGSLSAGAVATVSIVITPGPFGPLTNSLSVTENETDANPADNSLVLTNLVVPLTFYPGPNLNVARSWHTATLLPDGRVLIAGGNTGWGGSPLASAEIYDPATKMFTFTGNMYTARDAHVAALLADGTVLVAGGYSSGSFVGAELFNPTNGNFTSVSNLNNWHVDGTATLMQDGRVLVEGNDYYGTYAAAEIYVPTLHSFTNIGTTLGGGTKRPAFLLGDGKVLLPGGTIGNATPGASAEYYDPALNQFIALPPMNQDRYYNGGAQLLDGRVLIAGGNASGNTAEFFHTNSQSFVSATNLMRNPHWFCTANRLPDGKVLLAGFSQQPDLFNPANDSFSLPADMLTARMYYTATTLQDGSVLIVGGQSTSDQTGPALATTEIYDPARTKTPPSASITDATVTNVPSGTTNMVFNVTLSSAMGLPVSVDYATADGSAGAGTDYYATNGTLVFAPGTTTQTVTVAVIGTLNYEPAKTFTVNLSNPTNIVLNAASATGTIFNTNPVPTATVLPASVVKPNVKTTNLVINVQLSASSYQTITMNYATSDGSALAGTDYTATNGVLTFNPGTTNVQITVSVTGNTTYESNKVFYVALSSPTNVMLNPPGTEIIISLNGLPGILDHFTFSSFPAQVYATFPTAVTVTACDASNNVVTNFNSFVALSGNSSNTPSYWYDFEEGDFSQWTPLNLGNSPGPYQIMPFDVPGLGYTSLAFRLAANAGAPDGITRPVTLQANTTYEISADIAASNEGGGINADPGTAYLEINGQQIGTFNFGVFGEIGSQVFRTNLAAIYVPPTNGTYQLSIRFSRGYGESGVWNYADNVRVSAPPITPLWLTPFTNGVWSGSITLGANVSNLVLYLTDFNGHLGNSSSLGVITVLNYADLGLRTSVLPNPARVGSNIVCTAVITNNGASAANNVMFTNALPPNTTFISATTTYGTCGLSNGVIVANFGLLTNGQSVTVTYTYRPTLAGVITNMAGVFTTDLDPNLVNNYTTTTVTVNPPLLVMTGPTVVERHGTTTNAVFNISLSTPYSQEVDVDYLTSDVNTLAGVDYVPASGHLTFPPGVTNLSVTVTVLDDQMPSPNETFALNLVNVVNAQAANGGVAYCTIIDDFDPPPLISIADASIIKGTSGTNNCVLNVTLNQPTGYTVQAHYNTSSGTAVSGFDFVSNSGTLSIPPFSTNATVIVGVRGNTVLEPTVAFYVTLSSPVNCQILRSQATGTILDTNTAPGQFDHFAVSAIPSPQYAGLTFPVTLAARDAYGDAFTGAISNTVNLFVIQGGTNFTIVSPSTAGPFTNGVWSGLISVTTSKTNLVLRADDGQQHIGTSNPFDVLAQNALVLTLPVGTNENAGVWTNAGKVSLPRATGSTVTVNLSSSLTSKVTVPASVTIAAGQSNALFNLTLVDNAILDGTQVATITASASGYLNATAPFSVYDSETATLSVGVPATVSETVGSVQGTVTISTAPAATLSVALTSSDPARIQVPASLAFSSGQANKAFTLTVINDKILQGAPENVTITAHVQNWTDGVTNLSLLDDETATLMFQFTGGGAVYSKGTMFTPNAFAGLVGSVSTNVTITLASGNTNLVIAPATVVVPAGSNTVPLNLTIGQDNLQDGTQYATLTATAPGFTNATAQVTILDNNWHHFDFSAVSSPQQGSVAFGFAVTARDVNDVLMTPYNGYVTLSAQDNLGHPVPLSPASITVLNGQWSGNLTVTNWQYQGVCITATDSDGHSSISAPFDVVAPTVYVVNVSSGDIAYSAASGLLYASTTNTGSLTPINPFSGAVSVPVTITNLSGRLCASDGGQYIFAALNDVTNHICQFDVNAGIVAFAWPLDGTYVDDMAAVAGSPAAVAVSRQVLNRSPRFAGLVVYDNGVARSNSINSFLGPNRVEPGRLPGRLYGYDNESSPAGSQIMQVNASGVTQVGGWGTLQGFGVDISCRGGWLFATTGQIIDPERGIQVGSFSNTSISDDAASGRYYLIYGGGLIAYDQNTLLPVGITVLPGVTSVAGSFVRFGTNGFVVRMSTTKIALVRSSLVSVGGPADLQLSVAYPQFPVPAPQFPLPAVVVTNFTLTVSNLGPATATNVVLTQTLPVNSTFISATGSNVLSGGGLVSFLTNIPVGGSASVTVNLQMLKPGLLTSVASVTSDTLDPNLSNNVLHLSLPVAAHQLHDTVIEATLPTADIAWDKSSGRIFASVPNTDWLLGNNLVALDPVSGNYDAPVYLGLDPGKVAVADNGQYLYSGINGDTTIQRVDLASRTADLKFPTGLSTVADMAVLPGSPQSVAVTARTTFAVYDNGVMRPNTVGPGPYNFDYYLTFSISNTVAYEGLPYELRRIGIDTNGATVLDDNSSLINGFDRQIKFDAGRLYSAGGSIIDPVADVLITNLAYGGLSCPDSHGVKIFYLNISGSTGTLHAVNMNNLVEVGSVTITNINGSVSSLIRWGVDGLAFRTSANQLFLIRTTFADDINNDGLPDSWQIANFGSLYAPGSGPLDDPDHDGMDNYQEWIAGTNPNDPNSNLRMTALRLQGNGVQVNWQGGTNVYYRIQRTPNLSPANWQDVYTNLQTSPTGTFMDYSATAGASYYRIKVGWP